MIGYPQLDEGQVLQMGLMLGGEFLLRATPELSFKLIPRLYWDPINADRSRWIPTELYVRSTAGPVDITVGMQRFEWGVSTLFRPTDTLNQRDYGTSIFRGHKLGDPAVALALHLAPITADVVFMPLLQHPTMPQTPEDFGLRLGDFSRVRPALPTGFDLDDPGLSDMTFAARVRGNFGPVDAELMWMSGPSRVAGPWLDDVTLRSIQYPVDVFGASVSGVIDPFIIRGEIAVFSSERAPLFREETNPQPWTEPIPATYAAYVVGAEYTAWDIVGDHDLTITLEYAGELREFRDAQAILRPWDHDLFIAARYQLDDLDDTWFSASAAIDVRYGDTVLTFGASRHLIWNITLELDAIVVLEGTDDDAPLSLVRELADRDSLRARFTWAF